MIINSIAATSIATAVWTTASRTLTALAGQPATDIWAAAARTITGMNPGTAPTTTNGTLAVSTVLDLRAASNTFRLEHFSGTCATANIQPGIYDGTTFTNGEAPVANYDEQYTSTPGTGYSIKNTSGVNTITYVRSGIQIS